MPTPAPGLSATEVKAAAAVGFAVLPSPRPMLEAAYGWSCVAGVSSKPRSVIGKTPSFFTIVAT